MFSIANKIKELRNSKGITQEDIANRLGVSRPTYIDIESGKRSLTIEELNKLSYILSTPFEELLFDTALVQTNDFGMDKYKQIILNCLKFGGDSRDGKTTKTKLAKLSYLADFAWFYENLEPMSGLAYKRLPQGPVPETYFRVVEELFEDGLINIQLKGTAQMISLNEQSAPQNKLSSEELRLVKKIASKWKDKNTEEIVEFTHNQLPWKICKPNELIPYELITQEDPDNVY